MNPSTRPDDQILRMMEQTLMPSPHVAELDPDPLAGATSRFATAGGSVAERAHLASVLTPTNATRQLCDQRTASLIRQRHLETGADGVDELRRLGSNQVRELDSLGEAVARCLDPYREMGPHVAPLFVADVIVSADDRLWKVVPGTGHATFETRFDPPDAMTVATALEAWPPDVDPSTCTFVFVVGAFSRALHLSSGRAHRSAQVQAGRVAGAIESAWFAQRRPDELFLTTDTFLDRDVDAVLRNDGVERATLAVLAICPLSPAPTRGATDDHDR